MSDYEDDEMETKPQDKTRRGFKKQVAAATITEAVIHIADWSHDWYDMYLVSVEPYPDREDFIAITVVGWENTTTRERYKV